MITQERLDAPTPMGGTYSIAYYHDGKGNAMDKKDATHLEIVEFNKDDEQIFRTHAELKK